MKTSRPHSFGSSGFSLVEVTLAVAIAALGFITLLGLLPTGINMAKEASRMSTGSRIIQRLNGELQSMDWDDINWKGYSPLRYFNSEGSEISTTSADADALTRDLAYVASIQLPTEPLDVVLPTGDKGSASGTQPAQFLRRVKICVASSSNPKFDFEKAPALAVTSSTTLVARMSID